MPASSRKPDRASTFQRSRFAYPCRKSHSLADVEIWRHVFNVQLTQDTLQTCRHIRLVPRWLGHAGNPQPREHIDDLARFGGEDHVIRMMAMRAGEVGQRF